MFLHRFIEKVGLDLITGVVHKYTIEDFPGAVFTFKLD